MKKIIACILCATFLAFTFTGCANQKKPDLYEMGLDMTSILGEMVKSDEYTSIIGSPSLLSDFANEVKNEEFSSPTAVYKVDLPKTEILLEKTGLAGADEWNLLSDNLKAQIENRISFSQIVTIINSSRGTEALAFSSLYQGIIKNDDIISEKPVTYIFVYGQSISVAVTYNYKSMTGQFLFAEELTSLDTATELFSQFGCTIEKIK